jgi:hypothetical protein
LAQWEGLSKDVIIPAVEFRKAKRESEILRDRGQRQVIAGYYDANPEKFATGSPQRRLWPAACSA